MTDHQIKTLNEKLWAAANGMRANSGLKASEYATPVLGLIFLKFVDTQYRRHEEAINEELAGQTGRVQNTLAQIAIRRAGFYLPEKARYDYLLQLPGDKRAAAIKEAVDELEKHLDEKRHGMLPTDVYFRIENRKGGEKVLTDLLRSFNDIPEDAGGDVFGRIYEYFLGKFALSEGQKGGEFFTPTSVVSLLVEVIEPYGGELYDPACGSGGMFVQSAGFLKAHRDKARAGGIAVYGQERTTDSVRLARMNLFINNLRGTISPTNSYHVDPFSSKDRFDYVMANPPFNVKGVKKEAVDADKRFTAYGLPSDKKGVISNANYLWINLIVSSLKAEGRAALVMANSAADAGGAEKDIRKKLVDADLVDCMVSMPSNMFLTVTLPATLWFFDKAKQNKPQAEHILFIDAREVYRQVDRAHRVWTDEQVQNLATIVRLYRGEHTRFTELIFKYLASATEAVRAVAAPLKQLRTEAEGLHTALRSYHEQHDTKLTPAKTKKLQAAKFEQRLTDWALPAAKLPEAPILQGSTNAEQRAAADRLKAWLGTATAQRDTLQTQVRQLLELYALADKNLKGKSDKAWSKATLPRADKDLENTLTAYADALNAAAYWYAQLDWLQSRFPEGRYRDVTGLCKKAPRSEYADEQDYSLNPGRYVGVKIEEDNLTEAEFRARMSSASNSLSKLKNEADSIMQHITTVLAQFE